MTRSSVKQLFRRCILIASMAVVVTGCANTSGIKAPIEDRVVVVKVVKAIPTVAISEPVVHVTLESQPITSSAKEVPDKNLALEIPQKDEPTILAENIQSRFRNSPLVVTEIITLATQFAYTDFPKRNDILAIIEVESSYNARALLRGSYGLMQIERKSHLKRLNKRSLYNPSVNVEIGAAVLNEYYNMLDQNKKAAILAYNSGIGNYLKGRYHIKYYQKYKTQLTLLNK